MVAKFRDDIMGMPIVIKIVDDSAAEKDIDDIFRYFQSVDKKFSTYKKDSEISRFNRKEIQEKNLSGEMKLIFRLSEQTKKETNGFFDIKKANGLIDPSGLVKGWAIWEAAKLVQKMGFKNFFIEAGGDIQAEGLNEEGKKWRVGIRNPFSKAEIVKVLSVSDNGVATSGTYERGQHIYDPHTKNSELRQIVSITVVGPNIYEADRFATAAFAMQQEGIHFIEKQKGLEGYMIDKDGMATMTSGFETYVGNN